MKPGARPRGPGRRFTANDPRANRKGRPRKVPVGVELYDEIAKAAAAHDFKKLGKLIAAIREPGRTMELIPEDVSTEDLDQAMRTFRAFNRELFLIYHLSHAESYETDREAYLRELPEWIARRKLGLLAADPVRGWQELFP
jgi:hypothetical protein